MADDPRRRGRIRGKHSRVPQIEQEETMKPPLLRWVFLAAAFAVSTAALAQSSGAPKKEVTAGKTAPASMKLVATEGAPKAIGPYSQAVVEGGFLFAAGQIPLDPKTGEMVTGGIEQSAERVLDNLEAVLKAEGLSFSDVVKTTVFLTKAEDFAALNAVYGRRMGDHKPARSTVIVAALPRNAPLEMDLIARARR
jgi:2-iminobutanoate/2-iminopropanoate deaminase